VLSGRLGRLAQSDPRCTRSAITRSAIATCGVQTSHPRRPRPADRDIIHSECDLLLCRRARRCATPAAGFASVWASTAPVTAASAGCSNLQVFCAAAPTRDRRRVVAAHPSGLSSLFVRERDLGFTLIAMAASRHRSRFLQPLVMSTPARSAAHQVTPDHAPASVDPACPSRPHYTQIGRAVAIPTTITHHRRAAIGEEEMRTGPTTSALDPGR